MATSNAERAWNRQVRDTWNAAAEGWERWEAFHFHYLSAVNPILLRALRLAPGQRVLDAACGPGEPALEIAHWVQPGEVVGLDVAAPMLAVARRRAKALGIRNVRFVRGDLARPPRSIGRFDRIVSRFGLMFVPDVEAALAGLRGVLAPRGRVAFAVWGPIQRNPFFSLIHDHARPLLVELPDPETTPHPFRLARRDALASRMRSAGFRDIVVEPAPAVATYPDAATWFRSSVETSSVMRSVRQRLSAREAERLRVAMERAVSAYASGAAIRIPGFAWVVSGRR
jgi:ubiquinone/menaquinone biosynthesis C-methylase UbiE